MSEHKEGKFTSGGVELYYQCWLPDGEPKGVVAIDHGMGEHSGRYPNLVNALLPENWIVYGYDKRGHGRSGGQRGHIMHFEDYRQDVDTYLKLVFKEQPGLPVFLYGHSLGSLTTLDYIMHTQSGLAGAIVSGTAVDPVGVASPAMIQVAKIMSKLLPTFCITSTLDPYGLSQDEAVCKAYIADPMVHNKMSARYGMESLKTVEWIKAHPELIQIPVMFVHGEKDPILTLEGAKKFYASVPYPDKEMHVYLKCKHEVHNDFEHANLMADVLKWLSAHVAAPVAG